MREPARANGKVVVVNASHAHTADRAADLLRERISTGALRPGAKLPEERLAAALEVSRNTLRQAFTLLAGEGVVERIPNRGVFVTSPGEEGVREIYRVRRVVEPAALLWGTPDAATLGRMRGIVDGAREAKGRGDIDAMAAANQAFHREVIALTGSETLSTMMERVLARMRLVFFAMSDQPDFHSHYVDLNAQVVGALDAGDGAAAAALMRDYLDRAEAELLGHVAAQRG